MPVAEQDTFASVSDPSPKQILLETLGPVGGSEADMTAGMTTLVEFVHAYASPDFVCAMFPLPPTPSVEYRGPDGVARAWSDWSETFASVRVEPEEVCEGENAVVLLAEQIAVTRHGGVEIRQPSAMLWLFGPAGLERLEFHLDRDAALEAGGFRKA